MSPLEQNMAPEQLQVHEGGPPQDENISEKQPSSAMAVSAAVMPSDDGQVANKSLRTASWFAVAGCSAANFSDGYQQQIATNVNVIFAHLYGTARYTSDDRTRISNALIVGQILGILLVGFITDAWSRRAAMVLTSSLVVAGSLMATLALSVEPHLGLHSMLWFLTVVRGVAGVGVGGEFPSGATAACEGVEDYKPARRGPVFVAATTFVTCWGGPACIFVYLMTLLATGNDLTTAYISVNAVSVVLPLLVFLFRLRMVDSRLFRRSNFTRLAAWHRGAAPASSGRARIPLRLILKRYWFRLAGTSGAFFIYDFVNFPNSIMSSSIIDSLVGSSGGVRATAQWQLVLALLTLPGVVAGMLLVNRLGRRWTGILGFGGYLVLGLVVGGTYADMTRVVPAFVVVYGLMQSVGHMGPGATLGLVSTESFPTAVRGVCYAISAAFGKAGAAVGTEVFTPIGESLGQRWTFFFAAIFGAFGMAVYWFMIEDMTKADLLAQDKDFEMYLRENGWEGEIAKQDNDNST